MRSCVFARKLRPRSPGPATREALEIALSNKAFGRAFHGKGRTTPELPDLVERLLERAAIEALSLANKAGRVITGFAKVEAALEAGKLAGLMHAREAARDGMNKLNGAVARAVQAGKPAPIRVLGLAGEQLDLALGRPNVVHAGLLAHPASRGFLARWLRLQRWRTGSTGGDAVESVARRAILRTWKRMTDTNDTGEKTLRVAPKTLTLKRSVEHGTVRQSFSHGAPSRWWWRGEAACGRRRSAAEPAAPVAQAPERASGSRTFAPAAPKPIAEPAVALKPPA